MMRSQASSHNSSLDASAVFSWPVRIYYEDTDAGGVVYHSNYLKYMERARSEWLRSLGRPVADINQQENKLFVVRRAELDYKKPCVLDELLSVQARIGSQTRTTITLNQDIYCGDTLRVRGNIQLAVVDKDSFRPVSLPHILQLAR